MGRAAAMGHLGSRGTGLRRQRHELRYAGGPRGRLPDRRARRRTGARRPGIGNGRAEGLCGSGMVDLVAYMVRTGRLDRIGNFGAGSDHGLPEEIRRIMPQKKDIDMFQRAKAAIGAGMESCRLAPGRRRRTSGGYDLRRLRTVFECDRRDSHRPAASRAARARRAMRQCGARRVREPSSVAREKELFEPS